MIAEDETVVHTTPNAPWLPAGSHAEVVRSSSPPHPMCVVRLLLRRADQVFCTLRQDIGRLDLPMRVAETDDPSGASAVRALADEIVGADAGVSYIGAVRNVVSSPDARYAWPTPIAHFGVWTSASRPLVAGSWVSIAPGSALGDRHWYPLIG